MPSRGLILGLILGLLIRTRAGAIYMQAIIPNHNVRQHPIIFHQGFIQVLKMLETLPCLAVLFACRLPEVN